MVNLTQLFLPQVSEGQAQGRENAKARGSSAEIPFSSYVERASGNNSRPNTPNAHRTEGRTPAKDNRSDARKADGQDTDWSAAASAASGAQTQPADNSGVTAEPTAEAAAATAQEAPQIITPTWASVDTLEGVELFNIVGGMTDGASEEDAPIMPIADMAGDTDVEQILGMAEDSIEYVSGNQPSPLENVSSQAAAASIALKTAAQVKADAPAETAAEEAQLVDTTAASGEEAVVQTQQTQQQGSQDADDTSEQGNSTQSGSDAPASKPVSTAAEQRFDPSMTAQVQAQPTVQNEAVQRLTQSVLSQAAEGMERAVSEGQSRFTIQMKPEFLGRLAINLVMGEDGLTARIRSADPGVRGMLSTEIAALTQSLRDKGITVVNVEVMQHEMADTASDFSERGDTQADARGHHGRGGRAFGQDTAAAAYGEDGGFMDAAAQGITAQGATVEYEA